MTGAGSGREQCGLGRVRSLHMRGGSGQYISISCGFGAGLNFAEQERSKNFNPRRTLLSVKEKQCAAKNAYFCWKDNNNRKVDLSLTI